MKSFVSMFYMFLFLAPSFIACQKEPIEGVAIVRAIPSRVTFYDIYGVKSVQVVSDKSPENDVFLFRSTDILIHEQFKAYIKDSATVRIKTRHETIISCEAFLTIK